MENQQVLEKYAEIFQKTFSAATDQQRKDAEELIQKESMENPQFLQNLIQLISLEQTSHHIKQSASVYINTFTRQIVVNQNFTEDIQQKTSEIFFEALLNQQILQKYKQPIVNSLTLVLQFDQQNKIKTVLFDVVVNILKQDNVTEKLNGCFQCLQSIINSVQSISFLTKISQSVMERFCQQALILIQAINTKLQELGQQNQNIDEQTLQEFKKGIEILQTWTQTFSSLLSKYMENEERQKVGISQGYKQLMQQLIFNQSLGLIFMQFFQISMPNQYQIPTCVISTTNIQQLDDSINLLKSKVMRQYTRINQYMFEKQGKLDCKNSTIYQLLTQILPYLLGSVYNFCIKAQDKLFDILQNEQMSKIVVECLIFLKTCGNQQEYYPIYAQNKKQIVLNVLLPLLRTSPQEKEQFEDTSEEFVHMALDTCDKQFSETFKTASAQVLEILCDNIDGSISLIGSLCISIIKHSLVKIYNPQQEEVMTNNPNFPALNDTYDSLFLKYTTPEERIETCLMAFSIMSYLIPKRQDIVQELEILIEQNANYLLSQNTGGILRSRTCLFIGYYSDTIFQKENQTQIYQKTIEFLIECTALQGQDSISQQAIDSLINIYEEDSISQRLTETIMPVFEILIKQIQHQQSTQFLDLVQTITYQFQPQISNFKNYLTECIKQLVERIKIEYNLILQKERTTQLYINKCWNIIRSIADNDLYVTLVQDEMEELLQPLLQALSQPDKIEFDDDILLTITAFLKKRKQITPTISSLFQYFPLVFKKYDNVFGHMIQTLNLVLEYGDQYFQSNNQESNATLEMILQLCQTSVLATGQKVNEADNAEGALLLQQIIYKYNMLLSDQMWQFIFKCVIEKLQKDIHHNFLTGRLLGVFLQGFRCNLNKTQEILGQQMGVLNDIMKKILQNPSFYSTKYDVKIFVFSMSSLISLQPPQIDQQIYQFVPQILDYLITLLRIQQVQESKKKKKVDSDSDNDDDDDNDAYDSDYDQEYNFNSDDPTQDRMTLSEFITSYKDEDEFKYFKDQIFVLKGQNQENLVKFVKELNEDKQNFLKEVLSVQRIQVGNQSVPRKIVRRKKN